MRRSAAAALAGLWVTADVTSIPVMTQTILEAVLIGVAWLVAHNAGSGPNARSVG
jgi:hypothetical protein